VEAVAVVPAEEVCLQPIGMHLRPKDWEALGYRLDGLPVQPASRLRVALMGSRSVDFLVVRTRPSQPVQITPATRVELEEGDPSKTPARRVSYEDIGGLGAQLRHIRETVEWPLKYPEVFARLGIAPPKGVLLHGPPGCGKTLIARAIADESQARFFSISGPEIIHKFYGESEAHLRKIFAEASARGPSIIFMDEVDAIAPKRSQTEGNVEKRVVAQLLALMDGLDSRQQVIVLGATNLPDAIDPALRRPGRFDRELVIPVPDQGGREEILGIMTRGMPLEPDVCLATLAARTHGFVGADLAALCQEAALASLRRQVGEGAQAWESLDGERIARLTVQAGDFQEALRTVAPSAIREVIVENPKVPWERVGGLQDCKKRLEETVLEPLRYPRWYAQAGLRPPRGILLSGPPGCGKTMLAKALATETGYNLIALKGPELLSKFVGESEARMAEIFRKARQVAPCLLFFDEIDGLLPARSEGASSSPVTDRVLSQFLAEMDGLEELRGVLVLAATNRRDRLDPAALRAGRFDEWLEVGLPDREARMEILRLHLADKAPLAPDLSLDPVVDALEGASGADLAAIASLAARCALKRCLAQAVPLPSVEEDLPHLTLNAEDFRLALEDWLRQGRS
jgi:transitional endoplasmic reticulum ATPase